jgi:hypothetical protein
VTLGVSARLRSGARTVGVEKVDLGRVFDKDGRFAAQGHSGTNAVYTWNTEAGGVHATVRFYMQVCWLGQAAPWRGQRSIRD